MVPVPSYSWGASSQTVNYGGNGSLVVAGADEGYHFTGWSDGWVNPGGNHLRRDMNVTADINVTASFAPNTYTLSYAPGENGSLLGQTPQSVYYGQDGAAVQAVPDTGYYFVSWSDGNTDNPRVDTNVQGSLTVTANFAYIFSPEFNLTSYLPVWMEFLRDTSSENPKDTLAWFRDDPYAMYDYVLTLDWGSNYNLWIAWIYGVWIERNSSLVIDCATLLNLNVEDQGRSIADIVELYCMELILKDTDHTLHASTKAAYLSNLAKWHEYYELLSNMFPQFSAPPLGIQFLQAAYSTLDPVAGILAANFYGVHLSRLYNIALPKPPGDFITLSEFVQHDDLDTDGYTNLEEFYYVNHMLDFPLLNACNGVKDSGVANALDIYANYLLNGQIKPGINKPPVTYDYPWQSCICSSSYAITKKIQSEYYNNYFSGDEGMILLEPQKERYQLGERVQITYVPSVDTRLVRWDVDPASHTAKWSREQSTHIYITNNTTVTAVIRQQKNLMLNVHILNPEYGDVSSFSAFYDYGSTVSPHISPDPGYVCNWLFAPVSYKSRLYNDENPSIYMEGSVSLSVVYEGEDDRFSYGPISTISIDGGTGKILASNGYCCCTHDDNDIFHQCGCATGPYLRNSVTRGQGYFSARCIPDPDFSFGYWKFSDGSGNYYCTHNEVDSLPSVSESALTAHLVPTISLEVQVEGEGVVTSGGFRSYYPSRIYYTSTYLDTFKGERIDANRVQMQHNACPGWGFDHWEIQDAQGEWTTVLNPQGQTEIGDLTVYMNWSGPSSQIHPAENQERFRVKAVFEETCVAKLKLCVRMDSEKQMYTCYVWPYWDNVGHAWIEIEHYANSYGLNHSYGFFPSPPGLTSPDLNDDGWTTISRYYAITCSQYKRLEALISWYDEVKPPYIFLAHNCASFAALAVFVATGEWISPYNQIGPNLGVPYPAALCINMQIIELTDPTWIDHPKRYCPDGSLKTNSLEDSLSSENYISNLVPTSIPQSTPCYSIQDAVTQDDSTFINGYLSAGGDIDTTDSYGKTVLHYAIETGQIDMIDFLLAKGANAYGLFYDPATGLGYENTPLFAANQLQNDCEFEPNLCTAILTVIAGAAAAVDTDSTAIVNYMANDNVSGIMNVLAPGKAIYRETMEQLSWYALENNDLTLFTAAIQHPSFSLLFTAEDFFNELIGNKTQYQSWINLMRNYSNRSFYVYVKYACTDWEYTEDEFLDSLLIMACAQGNLDLVNFLLPLGADPIVQVTEEETLLEYIGKDWSQLGFTFPMVLPDWPTDKDAEILQALQAYVPSP